MINGRGLRCKLLLLLFGLGVAGCRPEMHLRSASSSPIAPGEVIFALTPRQTIRFESLENSLLEVGWSKGSLSCEVSDPIAGTWVKLREVALYGKPDVRADMSLDPNRYTFGSTVAFVRSTEGDRFHIWYVEGMEEMARATSLVQEVLDECQTGVQFDVTLLKEVP